MDSRLLLYICIILGGVSFKMIEERYSLSDVRKSYIIFICILLALETGLRHLSVGPDTYTYYKKFQRIGIEEWDIIGRFIKAYVLGTGRDPGYPILMKTFQLFSNEFHWFLLMVNLLFFYSFGLFIYKNSLYLRDAVFAFVLFVALFHVMALSGIRQQVATAFAFFALTCIQNRKHTKFFIIVLLGSTIHISLLLIIPLWMLSFLPSKYIKFIFFVPFVLLPFIIIGSRNIVLFMTSFMGNEYYQAYANSKNGGDSWAYVVLAIVMAFSGVINIKNVIGQNEQNKIYYIAIALMTFFVPLILLNGSLIRVGQYFSLYLCIFIPLIINNFKISDSEKHFIFSVLMVSLIILSFRNSFEYYFYWQDAIIPREYIR